MNKFEQVVENVSFTEYSEPFNLNAEEFALVERVRDAYRTNSHVSCTACRYCMPCANGVDIPRIFEFYDEAVTYGDVVRRQFMYGDPNMINAKQRADKCIKCEKCVEKCPQKINIPEMLEKAHAFLIQKT
jgi:predicted aldo/keto reductase-like oxidoreductase